jgi:hypothetical protein
MSFQEDFAEFLDEEQGFAVKAKVTPSQGQPYFVTGILSSEYLEIDGGMAGISGSRPVFECAAKSLISAEYGDLLTVNGQNFRIVEIKPDGSGWASLILEKQ